MKVLVTVVQIKVGVMAGSVHRNLSQKLTKGGWKNKRITDQSRSKILEPEVEGFCTGVHGGAKTMTQAEHHPQSNIHTKRELRNGPVILRMERQRQRWKEKEGETWRVEEKKRKVHKGDGFPSRSHGGFKYSLRHSAATLHVNTQSFGSVPLHK